MTSEVHIIDKRDFNIPMSGHPLLHHELAWYGAHDDAVLGVVVLDLVDHDFSWVVLTQNDQGPGYSAVDLGTSLPTISAATQALHAAMEGAA
jgi:hypothetical protein